VRALASSSSCFIVCVHSNLGARQIGEGGGVGQGLQALAAHVFTPWDLSIGSVQYSV
jgi:hypothetical protein